MFQGLYRDIQKDLMLGKEGDTTIVSFKPKLLIIAVNPMRATGKAGLDIFLTNPELVEGNQRPINYAIIGLKQQ